MSFSTPAFFGFMPFDVPWFPRVLAVDTKGSLMKAKHDIYMG